MSDNIQKLKEWLAVPNLDSEVKAELEELYSAYEKDPENADIAEGINDRFYREMEFGTAGVRGIIGAGTNRMNIYTVRRITQGFSDKINEQANLRGEKEVSVAIAYDNRIHSDLFSFEAACVFAANGINVHIFSRLSATPLLSYAVRKLSCTAGVVVTSSHNAKEYNGYKIYDNEGCQCLPEDASAVAAKIDGTDIWSGVKTLSDKYEGSPTEMLEKAAESEPLIHIIPQSVEDAYIEEVLSQSIFPGACENVSAVYTPLNGTGNIPVRKVLSRLNIGKLETVKEQEWADPEFTTCPEPNPEKEGALRLGLALCEKRKAEGAPPDILIATDPDCDRLGLAVYHDGKYVRLTGNQVGILMLDYIIEGRKKIGTLPTLPVFVSTVVSTPMGAKMAKDNGIEYRKVLTGFRWIGDQLNKLHEKSEVERFIFGYEESCGYLSGTYARDKEATNASLLACEMTGFHKRQGKTLLDRYKELFERYGYYIDDLTEFVRPGEKGLLEIAAIMKKFRDPAVPEKFSVKVTEKFDYDSGEAWIAETGETVPIDEIPKSDVVEFDFEDGSRAVVRPSGTEPKLKIYFSGVGKTEKDAQLSLERLKKEMGVIAE